MKYRKTLFICLVCLLLTTTLLYAVFAYMFKQTGTVDTKLVPAQVSCEVVEAFDGTTKTSITVRNTGNIDAYLRVRLVSYWVNDADEIMPVSSEMPAFTVNSDWLDMGDYTYCYVYPVAPNGLTPVNLLGSDMVLKVSDDGNLQVVQVFAEAVQANPADAVQEAWGVSVDSTGKITGMN